MWSKPVRSPGLDRVKKIFKSLVNACEARKLVDVCLPCISVEMRVDDFRIRENMFTNIHETCDCRGSEVDGRFVNA